ncbi:hypothetical protein D3C86_1106860 [compost metagenome]
MKGKVRLAQLRFEQRDLVFTELVALGLALRGSVARCDVRIQVAFAPGLLVLLHARGALQLSPQEVDFLVVAAGLLRLQDELNQPHFERTIDAVERLRVIPLVRLLPAVHGRSWNAEVLGDLLDLPPCPSKEARSCTGLRLRRQRGNLARLSARDAVSNDSRRRHFDSARNPPTLVRRGLRSSGDRPASAAGCGGFKGHDTEVARAREASPPRPTVPATATRAAA